MIGSVMCGLAWSVLLFTVSNVCALTKPYNMSILTLLPVTGDEPRNGEGCKAAVEVFLAEINSRTDILPDYNLRAVYTDEGPGSFYSTKAAITFRRQYETGNASLPYQSPVFMGPYFSSGCLSFSQQTQYSDLVQIAVGCNTPVFTANRRIFPNLYKSMSPSELVIQPQLHFIREVGRWNRFGILGFAGNVFTYTLASMLLAAANNQGFEVSFFDNVNEVDDYTIDRVKESDSRIVVVSATQSPFVIQFLCQAYRVGISGSRYIFLVHASGYFEPLALNDKIGFNGCNKTTVLRQLDITFWMAWSMFPSAQRAAGLKSSIGLSLAEFEARYNQYSGNNTYADYEKRLLCHDSMMNLVLSLDRAEKKLSGENMSLRDYRDRPTLVMKVVNQSVAEADFIGYRLGSRFKYSARLEYDNDIQALTIWTKSVGKQLIFETWLLPNRSIYDYEGYQFQQVTNAPWMTETGKPPRDRAFVIVDISAVPVLLFWFIIAAAGVSTLIQIYILVKGWKLRSLKPTGLVSLLGSCLLSCSAGLFAVSAGSTTPNAVCILQRLFTIFGITVVHSSFEFSFFFYRNQVDKRRTASSAQNPSPYRYHNRDVSDSHISRARSNTIASITSASRRPALIKGREKFTLLGTALMMVFTSIYSVAWLCIEQPYYREELLTADAVYHPKTDEYHKDLAHVCFSPNDTIWIATAAGVHVVLLAAAALVVVQLKQLSQQLKDREYTVAQLNFTCVSTLFVGAIFIIIATTSPVAKTITLAIATLLISATNTAVVSRSIVAS